MAKRADYFGTLLVLSGLCYALEEDLGLDAQLDYSWSTIQLHVWSEQYRYSVIAHKSLDEVADFNTSVNYFLQWIKNHW